MEKSYTTLKDIEAALAASGSPYIQGDTPSVLDTEAFKALSKVPHIRKVQWGSSGMAQRRRLAALVTNWTNEAYRVGR